MVSAFTVEEVTSGGKALFTLFGVKYVASKWAWANVVLMVACGFAVALAAFDASFPKQLLVGLAFAALLEFGMVCHGFGHILSSRIVDGSMRSLVFTATVPVARYDDSRRVSRRVHVGRAIGGPALNLALAAAALTAWSVGGGVFVAFFSVVNALIGVFTLLPLPSLDGAVIWLRAGGDDVRP